MNIHRIKQLSDVLYPKLIYSGSSEFAKLCQVKKQIQEEATELFSEGDCMNIALSMKSEPVFSKLTKVGRNIYQESPTEENLFVITFAIATIIKEYEWNYDHYSDSHLSYISERVEKYEFDLDILLHSHLDDMNVYCESSRNYVSKNLLNEPGFWEDVQNWRKRYQNYSIEAIYKEISTAARSVVVDQYKWDEFDVDGFSWAIGVFSLICVKADLIPSFDEGFKKAFILYVNKGLSTINQKKKEMESLMHIAESGDADAQFKLAMAYVNGKDLSKNPSKATYWFEKAAMQGHVIAQYNIGQSYEKGIGVQVNEYKAFYWYMKAAENGDTDAISNVGLFYYLGKGTAIDYKKAVSYWTKASELNDDRATFNLGICYRDGQGVGEDWYKARELFEKAIKLGHPKASSALDQLNRRM